MSRCTIYMRSTYDFAQAIQKESQYAAIGDEIMSRLHKDQHELFHDAFERGCDYCDDEKKDLKEWRDEHK